MPTNCVVSPKVSANELRESYLAKAKEAEEEAKKALNPDTRKAWLKVAESYRHLARCFS
jgi:hypothetical protein